MGHIGGSALLEAHVGSVTPRPRLLFLCQALPFPPDGGVAIRSYNILRILAETYDITALCFYRRSVVRDVELSVAALGRFADVTAFPIEQEHSRFRLVWDHLKSAVARRVYTVAAYESDKFRAALRARLRDTQFDLVHMDSLDLSGYLDELAAIPTICVHHNVESALLTRRAGLESSWWRKVYTKFQSRLMMHEEQTWCSRVALNVVVSPADRDALLRVSPLAKVVVVPNGVAVEEFRPKEGTSSGIVFVGGMTWFPNRDALEYFAEEILPRVSSDGLSPSVTWVGRAFRGAREQYAHHGIDLTGYVDDVRPYVLGAACYVVPLRVGGGTRLKILDAWAMGKAVVSTSVGCEGLDARDGWNILVRDDPDEFAEAVRQVLQNSALRAKLERNARMTAERLYSWKIIGAEVIREYELVRGQVLSQPQDERTMNRQTA